MAVVVGKSIQDDKMILAAVKNVVVFVPALSRLFAKYAVIRLRALYVIDSPWSP